MAIHEYRCNACGDVFDRIVPLEGETGSLSCPRCKSQNVTRLISAPTVLKGGGREPGHTCCGRTERCEAPPCSTGDRCRRH